MCIAVVFTPRCMQQHGQMLAKQQLPRRLEVAIAMQENAEAQPAAPASVTKATAEVRDRPWTSMLWVSVWLAAMLMSSLLARSSFYTLGLLGTLLFPTNSRHRGSYTVTCRLPRKGLVAIVGLYAVVHLLALAAFGTLVNSETSTRDAFAATPVWFNAAALWDPVTQSKRFAVCVASDVVPLLLSIAYPFIVDRRAPPLGSVLRRRCLSSRIDVVLLTLLTAVAAFAVPSLIAAPVLLVHFCASLQFCFRRKSAVKWRLINSVAQFTTVYCALASGVLCTWSNAALQPYSDRMIGLRETPWTDAEFVSRNIVICISVATLAAAAFVSRRLHGGFGPLSDDEVEATMEAAKPSRGGSDAARHNVNSKTLWRKRLKRWVAETLPVLLLPVMVVVVTVLRTATTAAMVVVLCFGLVNHRRVFAASLPFFYCLLAAVITVTYVAIVTRMEMLKTITAIGDLDTSADQLAATVGLAVCTATAGMWIGTFVAHKSQPLSKNNASRREKRQRLERALEEVGRDLGHIEDSFTLHCDPAAGVVTIANLPLVIEHATGNIATQDEVQRAWEYFVGGASTFGASAIDATVSSVILALDEWDDVQSDEESDHGEAPKATPAFTLDKGAAGPSAQLAPAPSSSVNIRPSETLRMTTPGHVAAMMMESEEPDNVSFGDAVGVSTAAPFAEYPGTQARFAAQRGESFSTTAASQRPAQGLRFSDYVVLHGTVQTHMMHRRHLPFVMIELCSQLVQRNTTALTLLGMFAAATYSANLNAFKMGLILLFLCFLCAPRWAHQRYWPVLVAYIVAITVLLYAWAVVFQTTDRAPLTLGVASAEVIGLVVAPRVDIAINFVLLALAVTEARLFSSSSGTNFRDVLWAMEWRRVESIPGTQRVQRNAAIYLTGLCFVVIGLVEPNSALVAGFMAIFALVIVVGSFVPGARTSLWATSTLYSALALIVVSLYQFDAVEKWFVGLMADWEFCAMSGVSPKQCASDLGMQRGAADRALTFKLLPWFIACTTNVVQLTLRLRHGVDEEDSIGIARSASAALFHFDPVTTSRPIQLVYKSGETLVWLGGVLSAFLAVHGFKLVWVALLFAANHRAKLAEAAYAVLLTFDRRGKTIVLYSLLHILCAYVYPLFVVPRVPGLSSQWEGYIGIGKDERVGSLTAPVVAFATSMVYLTTLNRARKRADRLAREELAAQQRARRAAKRAAAVLQPAGAPSTVTDDDSAVEMMEQPLLEAQPEDHHGSMPPGSSPTSEHAPEPPVTTAELSIDGDAAAGASAPEKTGAPLQNTGGGTSFANEGRMDKPTNVLQHVLQLIFRLRHHTFNVLGFELVLLAQLITMVLTSRRATAGLMFVALVATWLCGPHRVMARPHANRFISWWLLFCALGLYSFRVGLPPDSVKPGPYSAACNVWWRYLGCGVPAIDIVMCFVCALLLRLCNIGCARRATMPLYSDTYDGFRTLGAYLATRRNELEDVRSLRRCDLETVLPPLPDDDVLMDPQAIHEKAIALYVALFPTSVMAFFHGALATSVTSVLEMLLGLMLIVYARPLYWRFFIYWNKVCAFFLLTLVIQLVANVPPVFQWAEFERPDVARSVGLGPWSTSDADFAIALQIAVIFSAFVQHRVFNSWFFAFKLRALYRGSVSAVRRHAEVMDYMKRSAIAASAEADDQDRRLDAKVHELRELYGTMQVRNRAQTMNSDDSDDSPSPILTHRTATQHSILADLESDGESAQADPTTPPPIDREASRRMIAMDLESSDAESLASRATPAPESPVKAPEAEESDEQPSVSERLRALRKKVDEFVEWLIVWMVAQSYRGKAPPSHKPQAQRFAKALWHFSARRTMELCVVVFTLNFVLSGTVADMLLCLVTYAYALVLLPWPPEKYWDAVLLYNVCGIMIKSVLKVVAQHAALSIRAENFISVMFLDLGIISRTPLEQATFVDIVLDFIVFAAILFHKQVCIDSGVYASEHMTQARAAEDPDDVAPPPDAVDDDDDMFVAVPETITRKAMARVTQSAKHAQEFAHGVVVNIHERSGAGADYYTVYLAIELVSLVYFAAAYYSLVGRASGSFIESVQQDLLPGPLVVFMLAIIVVMVVDRILYVVSALTAKYAFHVFLACLYHCAFVYWRFRVAAVNTGPGVGLFVIKMLYLYVCCVQIRTGFAKHRQHDPFTTGVGTLHWFGNAIYRSIPFLFEMRVLLDWTCSRTALKIYAWLTIEDVHRELYDRFYDIGHSDWTNPRRGMNYPLLVKAYTGVLGFASILLILFFPLMYYSTFNPNLRPNSISSVHVGISFGSYSQFYDASTLGAQFDPDLGKFVAKTRPTLAQYEITDEFKRAQLLQLTTCSARLWGISSQSRQFIIDGIEEAINEQKPFQIVTALSLSRLGATSGSSKTETIRSETLLDEDSLRGLHWLITGESTYGGANSSSANTTAGNSTVFLKNFFDPFVFNRPAAISTLSQLSGSAQQDVDCELVLHRNENAPAAEETWCVLCNPLFRGGNTPDGNVSRYPATPCLTGRKRCGPSDNYEANPVTDEFTEGPYLMAVSDPVPQDSNFLPNVGIIALYTTFILTLWSILRRSVTGYAHRIVMQQMARPHAVAELVRYIYLVRSCGSHDDLELEELLYFELLDLLRSPEHLLNKTGRRTEDYDHSGKFAVDWEPNL